MKSFISILKSPYPKEDRNSGYYIKLALISLFVSFFLFAFRPFNLASLDDQLVLNCLGFGLITFVVSVFYDFVFSNVLKGRIKEENYTLWKWVLSTLGLIICIGLANFLFLHLVHDMSFYYLGNLIIATLLVGVFPLLFIGMSIVLKGERKYEEVASEINTVKSEDSNVHKREVFGIMSSQILFIEGLQNYLQITYLDHSGKVVTITKRATMKSLEELVEGTAISRCHRSFFINTTRINSASGNAQGLKLGINMIDRKIPVSRRYVNEFRQ